jgi:hypothetical protein
VKVTHSEQVAKQLAKQGDDTVLRTYAPDFTRVREQAQAAVAPMVASMQTLAREVGRQYNAWLSGLEVLLSRHVDRAMVLEGRTLLLPQHSAEAEAAMSGELVACTLGQRDRPELVPAPPFA